MSQTATNLEDSNYSAALGGSQDDIALIEEQVDSGLRELLANYNPLDSLDKITADTLDQRFEIQLDKPMEQFDSLCAKAYRARDRNHPDRPFVALVCDPRQPIQQTMINGIQGVTNPALMSLREAGIVRLSTTKELRKVLFFDHPAGKPISALKPQLRQLHERQVIDLILAPIIDGLSAMQEKGLCHGRINADNIYFAEHAVLGECVSEPQGLNQNDFYEPTERLLAEPLTRGSATQKSDAYALGMLAFDIMFGLEQFEGLHRHEISVALLEKGAYHCYVAHKEFSDLFTDFFRGTLTENKQERWGIDQLRAWIGGKRFNLIMPSLPKEASRPFNFNEKDYFNCRALANAIYRNWPIANKLIRQTKLDRWLKMSAHQPERAITIENTIHYYGGEHGGIERVNNEMLSRLIIALDPSGPIRQKSIALNVDGIGLALGAYYKERDNTKIRMLLDIIEQDLATYWSDMAEGDKTALTGSTIWTLQRIRSHMGWKFYGFGMERVVYDLNPTLPCQSEWLLPYSVISISETLNVLDNLAKTCAENTSFADRQLAAFLASKIEMTKEVKFTQLSKVPKLRDHPELLALRIISLAQDKNGKQKMVGLATWAAIRVDKLLDNIHSRKLRRKVRQSLRLAAKTGMVSRVLAVVVENDMTKDDHLGFTRANTVYMRNSVRMNALENGSTLKNMSQDFGGRIAVFIAYAILCLTFYLVLDEYYI
jgi:hypothetical protein